jgi:hypothetical protein
MYRQPLSTQVVQQCLMLATALNSALRLLFVAGAGRLSSEALLLALASAPTVFIVNWLQRRYPPRLNATDIRRLAAVLLGLAGLALALRA